MTVLITGITILTAACIALFLWQRSLRSLRATMLQQHAECTTEITRLRENLAALEQSAQQIDEAKGGLARSMRAQVMHLLRSGMSPENAAQSLGIGRNDVRLLSAVSRALARPL